MSSASKLIIGPIIYYVLLFIVYSFIGLDIQSTGIEDANYTINESIGDINLTGEIGLLETPGFIRSISFTFESLPLWAHLLFEVMPGIFMILGIYFAIRGNWKNEKINCDVRNDDYFV